MFGEAVDFPASACHREPSHYYFVTQRTALVPFRTRMYAAKYSVQVGKSLVKAGLTDWFAVSGGDIRDGEDTRNPMYHLIFHPLNRHPVLAPRYQDVDS